MLANRGYAAYANSKIKTASPADLTLMLYEGAIKFCNIAIVGIEENDIEKAHTNIMKAERIISEFQATLDHKYPVAEDFDNVYKYLKQRLTEANVKKENENDARYVERSHETIGGTAIRRKAESIYGEKRVSSGYDTES